MSWADNCSNCGEHRADCECDNWKRAGVIKIEEYHKEKLNQLKDK